MVFIKDINDNIVNLQEVNKVVTYNFNMHPFLTPQWVHQSGNFLPVLMP